MKKIIYLLMSLSLVAFASCSDDDKDSPSSENGENGSNSGSQSAVFKSGTENGHDYVDLGLTSGTKWATANVGASKPQDYGNYYAWGEVTTKEVYNWETYKYGTYDNDGDYSKLTKYNSTDTKTTLDLSDDAAYVNWGGKWRMPTEEQWKELSTQCYWVWTDSYNGSDVKGYIVYKAKSSSDKGEYVRRGRTPSSSYSLSDAHIFLPAAGARNFGWLFDAGSYGYYRSSSLTTGYPNAALGVYFYSNFVDYGFSYGSRGSRHYGESVRAVIPGE